MQFYKRFVITIATLVAIQASTIMEAVELPNEKLQSLLDPSNQIMFNDFNDYIASVPSMITHLHTNQKEVSQYLSSHHYKTNTIDKIFEDQTSAVTRTLARQREKFRSLSIHPDQNNLNAIIEAFASRMNTLIESFTFINEKFKHLPMDFDQINVDTMKELLADQTKDFKEAFADQTEDVKELPADQTEDVKELLADQTKQPRSFLIPPNIHHIMRYLGIFLNNAFWIISLWSGHRCNNNVAAEAPQPNNNVEAGVPHQNNEA